MKLSNNFTVSEFEKSQTASRKGINNTMGPNEIENAKSLCENVLQKVRDQFGPVVISSGYRSPELNIAIGGSQTSQHTLGEAADAEVPGLSNLELALWIVENCEFDQLILEFHDTKIPNSGWVHVSYSRRKDNRKEILTATRVNGKTVYKHGLPV